MCSLFQGLKKKLMRQESRGDSGLGLPSSQSSPESHMTTQSTAQGRYETGPKSPRVQTSQSPAGASIGMVDETPPAYSISLTTTVSELPYAGAVHTETQTLRTTESSQDDPYEFLRIFDTIFLIDDSGSMVGSNWAETAAAIETITPICTMYDADGIDIHFLNACDNHYYHAVKDPATVREIFSSVRPRGGTPTGQKLNSILRPYLAKYAKHPTTTKPLNIIVITDGEPTDDVESPIIAAAKKLDKLDAPAWQMGIQFFQVGREPRAQAHLRQLDDELADIAGCEIRDMVDTVPFRGEGSMVGSNNDGRKPSVTSTLTGEGIMKVVLGAVHRRWDRKRSADLYRLT